MGAPCVVYGKRPTCFRCHQLKPAVVTVVSSDSLDSVDMEGAARPATAASTARALAEAKKAQAPQTVLDILQQQLNGREAAETQPMPLDKRYSEAAAQADRARVIKNKAEDQLAKAQGALTDATRAYDATQQVLEDVGKEVAQSVRYPAGQTYHEVAAQLSHLTAVVRTTLGYHPNQQGAAGMPTLAQTAAMTDQLLQALPQMLPCPPT